MIAANQMSVRTQDFNYRQAGMTIIEVTVAIVLLAVGLSALIKNINQSTINVLYLEQKTFSQWVALNKLNELQQLKLWPKTGIYEGKEIMAEQEWKWQLTVSQTANTNMRRVDIEVSLNQENSEPITTFSGFISHQLNSHPINQSNNLF